MEDVRFDAWTRRRFGLSLGGLSAALFGLVTAGPARAKKKKCKKNEQRCGKKCVKGNCCPGKPCGENCVCKRAVEGKTFCAKNLLIACEAGCASSEECGPSGKCIPFPPCLPDISALCVTACD